MTSVARSTFLLTLLLACASSPPRTSGFPDNRLGNYRFLVHVPNTQPSITLQGRITIERDTLILEPVGAVCQYDLHGSQNLSMVYHCAEVAYRFDRSDPVERSYYSLVTTTRKTVTRCVQYTRNSKGQTVCTATQTETEEQSSPRSGRLRPIREL